MVLVQINRVAKSFGVEQLFKDVSFLLQAGDRIGLVGPNGTGKSTLLKIIMGTEHEDAGQIIINQGVKLGYLSQHFTGNPHETLFQTMLNQYEELFKLRDTMLLCEARMSDPQVYEDQAKLDRVMEQYSQLTDQYEAMDGYAYESRIKGILVGLGFAEGDYHKKLTDFSGGQQTRIALAQLLVSQPDVLLLDEPTNHLDIETTEWLEEYLKTYPGCVLLVSHDRYFLDRTVSKVLDLHGGQVKEYKGNYSEFQLQKAEHLAFLQKEYEKQQAKIARLQAYIDRNRAGVNAKQARGRETRLQRMEKLDAPMLVKDKVKADFVPKQYSGENVCQLETLLVGYDVPLTKPLDLLIKRGEKVALVGANGTGKTSILKTLVSQLEPLAGSFKLGARVDVGYFSQVHNDLTPNATVLDEIVDAYVALGEAQARHVLARFLFQGDDVFKQIKNLSGGERARVVLCKLMLSGANFLVLDEPTNHLDIEAKEALEEILADYAGTVLFVSHDRYFIDQVTDYIVELEQGRLHKYLGDYTYYRWKKQQLLAEAKEQEAQKQATNRVNGPTTKASDNQKKRLKEIEAQIEVAEARHHELEQLLASGSASLTEIEQWGLEYNTLTAELQTLYELWEAVIG